MKTLNDFDFKNKKRIRVDFNVPLDNFTVTGCGSCIEAAKPTIDFIAHMEALFLTSHLGQTKRSRREILHFSPL
jgi:3-phosphoglycerate kinase